MAEITLPDLSLIWSSAGDILKPSDTKIQSGWAAEVPPRQWFNWLDNRQDQAIAHIAQHGIAVWSAELEYQAGKSYVQGSNGKIYLCIQTHTNQDPVSDIAETYWVDFFAQGQVYFTTVGTSSWTVPKVLQLGLRKAYVEVYGGGGGGARNTSAPGPGGGAQGGISKGLIDLTGVTSVSVTVGSGGAGATANPGIGSSGTASSFGAFLTANGGGGGINTGDASIGGTATGGDLNISGASGDVAVTGGSGAILGGGGGGGSSITAASGSSPTVRGHGGGGRTVVAGIAGAAGLVFVSY